MPERRFTEAEAAAIFERAASAQQSEPQQVSPSEGMTLAQLQAIGQEVGIPPALVARAAGSLDSTGRSASRVFLGFPIGVGRTVDLPRRLTDADWERLVVDLRETFDARGAMRSEGPFRQWTNGNLQALLEPTATGHRLRLRTIKSDARLLMTAGIGMVASSGAVAIAAGIAGRLASGDAISNVAMLGVLGIGVFALGALRIPGWARLRRRQMDAVAERLLAAMSSGGGAG